jgi:undecaprenyl-diphosphatase
VEGYFDRHGGKTILVGRFIGLVRALAPFIAGASGLTYRRFIPFSVVGTGLWATAFCVLGYVFWRSFDQVAHLAGQAVFGFGLTVGAIVGVVVAYRRREEIRQWFLARERRPLVRPLVVAARWLHRLLLRPVARVVGPEVRFLQDWLTVRLVTAIAVAGTGVYVFVLYLVTLAGSTGLTPFDRELFDAGRHLRNALAVDVAKLLSELGTFTSVTILLAVATVVLAFRGRPWDGALLILGFALVCIGVDVVKDAIDRPRPAGPLVSTGEAAFPSGHAAYATTWIAVAVALTRERGVPSQAAIVTGAVLLTAAIGMTRVYLRAHYWSDVAGGWALGIAIFGLIATIVLIVEQVRNNGRDPAPSPP